MGTWVWWVFAVVVFELATAGVGLANGVGLNVARIAGGGTADCAGDGFDDSGFTAFGEDVDPPGVDVDVFAPTAQARDTAGGCILWNEFSGRIDTTDDASIDIDWNEEGRFIGYTEPDYEGPVTGGLNTDFFLNANLDSRHIEAVRITLRGTLSLSPDLAAGDELQAMLASLSVFVGDFGDVEVFSGVADLENPTLVIDEVFDFDTDEQFFEIKVDGSWSTDWSFVSPDSTEFQELDQMARVGLDLAISVTPIPEPATGSMVALGLVFLSAVRRRPATAG